MFDTDVGQQQDGPSYSSGNYLGKIWFFFGLKRVVSLLLANCSLGFNVGHKTGALVNNSGAAVEMCWGNLNRLQGWVLRDEQL